jgi:hypothetical protein
MSTVVRKYRVRRGSGVEWTKRVQDSFVPLMRELKGFRGYYLIDGGPDVIITVSMFESADEALVSNEKAADWVRNNVLEFARRSQGPFLCRRYPASTVIRPCPTPVRSTAPKRC